MEHIREYHAVSMTFTIPCGINGCLRQFKNFLSFRTHVYQWHGGDPNVSNNPAVYMVPSQQTPLQQQPDVPDNTEDEVNRNETSYISNDGKNNNNNKNK